MFYATFIMMLFTFMDANAQIVYNELSPDVTIIQTPIGSSAHALDINNDGITDVTLTANVTSSSRAVWLSTPAGSESLMCCPILLAKAINSNVSIGPDASGTGGSWTNNIKAILRQVPITNTRPWGANPIPFGEWSNTTDRYFAIRFLIDGNRYYGWVRTSVGLAGNSFTIRDYAYNSVPNQSILAGDTGGSLGIIDTTIAPSMTLFPNPTSNQLTIAFGSINNEVAIAIADITGKIVYATKVNDTQKIEVNTSHFAEGIYAVQVQSDNFRETKKLIVVK
ncbi:T9SS type A sorting domain-containing protein [Flavobacterium sp. RSB2_4_14]|uniref:T9SS type A sorting domain-containing protein n=1 Tax=Flavobacterium sp. RSB2_4_14 TaxID=3447665 RepID=UPI003F3CD93F